MNVLFLTLGKYWSINESGLYTDLFREFINRGHNVYFVSPIERRENKKSTVICEGKSTILKVNTGNIQKTNIIEKGISTILIESQFLCAIKKHFNNVKFDLVLYATPPITFASVVKYIKKRDNAHSYLMLKDIFPQNAVDLGMMSTSGIKGLLYKYFRSKEKKLYAISDRIGCMSLANVQYVLEHNLEISKEKVEVLPNAISVQEITITQEEITNIKRKYHLPLHQKIFVYGGNLGKPQDIPFVIECLKTCSDITGAFFLIVGDGTEYKILEDFVNNEKPKNVFLKNHICKDEYDQLITACDVGLIFLDHRFTIPNFPSRLLGYMQAGLPVLACTDSNTDIGNVIEEGKFGWWCESNDAFLFRKTVEKVCSTDTSVMKGNAMSYLNEHYNIEHNYHVIINNMEC